MMQFKMYNQKYSSRFRYQGEAAFAVTDHPTAAEQEVTRKVFLVSITDCLITSYEGEQEDVQVEKAWKMPKNCCRWCTVYLLLYSIIHLHEKNNYQCLQKMSTKSYLLSILKHQINRCIISHLTWNFAATIKAKHS